MLADLIVIHVFHCTCISLIVKRLENFLICAIKDHIIIIKFYCCFFFYQTIIPSVRMEFYCFFVFFIKR